MTKTKRKRAVPVLRFDCEPVAKVTRRTDRQYREWVDGDYRVTVFDGTRCYVAWVFEGLGDVDDEDGEAWGDWRPVCGVSFNSFDAAVARCRLHAESVAMKE